MGRMNDGRRWRGAAFGESANLHFSKKSGSFLAFLGMRDFFEFLGGRTAFVRPPMRESRQENINEWNQLKTKTDTKEKD
jgi:hypothetical protein